MDKKQLEQRASLQNLQEKCAGDGNISAHFLTQQDRAEATAKAGRTPRKTRAFCETFVRIAALGLRAQSNRGENVEREVEWQTAFRGL